MNAFEILAAVALLVVAAFLPYELALAIFVGLFTGLVVALVYREIRPLWRGEPDPEDAGEYGRWYVEQHADPRADAGSQPIGEDR